MTDRAAALELEIEYWDQVIGGTYRLPDRHEFLRRRVNSEVAFAEYLRKYLRPAPAKTRILDVGAGPHTTLCRPSDAIEIVAVDPLATAYATLLARYGFTPTTPTIPEDAEQLVEQFGRDAFDLVYSRNALDHVENPKAAIREMLAVCKPGGVVFFEGNTNEANAQNYKHLHKWNFMTVEDGKSGDCVLWDQKEATLLSALIGSAGQVSTWRTGWYKVEIRKI